MWADSLLKSFKDAQSALVNLKSIVIPRSSDQLWIVTDGFVARRGIGATLYVMRDGILLLAGFLVLSYANIRSHGFLVRLRPLQNK